MTDFFAEHAVSEHVAAARPYIRFEQGDREHVHRVYEEGLESYLPGWKNDALLAPVIRKQKSELTRIVNQQPGWIMMRRRTEGVGLSFQIRPDKPIIGRPIYHFHGDTQPTRDTWPTVPTSSKKLPSRQVHRPEHMTAHIAKEHGGENVDFVHSHTEAKKYTFHPEDHFASCIDVHPFAEARMANANRVYFVLEGCIKADAILTELIETSDGESSVMSVPSVTMWDQDDILVNLAVGFASTLEDAQFRTTAEVIAALERGMRGGYIEPFDVALEVTEDVPEIIVVPDMDWHGNRNVFTQALLVRETFRRYGFRSQIAAPPIAAGQKGVDDFLAAGGTLSELEVLVREAPHLHNLLDLQHITDPRPRRSMERMLSSLALHALDDGTVSGSIAKFGRAAGLSRATAYRRINDLVNDHVIAVDDVSKMRRAQSFNARGRTISPFDFEDRPVFTIPAHLRANPTSFVTLAEHKESPVSAAALDELVRDVESLKEWREQVDAEREFDLRRSQMKLEESAIESSEDR